MTWLLKNKEDTEFVLKSIPVTILSIMTQEIEVLLECENVVVYFPRYLFDKDIIKYGSCLNYEICETQDGFTFQRFTKRRPPKPSNKKKIIIDLVDKL